MSIEEVRALVAERQRYDDWLNALDAKRADTPPRVFERVHADYLGRRADVIVRLQAHVGGLATLGDELQSRLSEVDAQLGAHEDELAEGMLRNLVGEYDGDHWDAVRQDIEAKISTLNAQRGALITEFDDVRTLLESARVMPAEVDAPQAESEAVVETAVLPPVEMPSVLEPTPLVIAVVEEGEGGSSAHVPTVGEWEGMLVETVEVMRPVDASVAYDQPDDDLTAEFAVTPDAEPTAGAPQSVESGEQGEELLDIDVSAMLDAASAHAQSHEDVLADVSVLFDTSSITAVPVSDVAPTAASSAPSSTQEFDDALAMFGEAGGSADPQFMESLQGIEADHDAGRDARGDAGRHTTRASVTPEADPFDDLAFLRSVTGSGDTNASAEAPPPATLATTASATPAASHEPQKTLRCTECGTMNLPTEWYCERCGGELAAF